ncbi:hypothetical protein DDZ13_01495 [Coraliomargarita sinensis]|uniref:Uncharacterized protein n=1 Tax=Coraliomargarita sinensis TaxID=2174842 RepID=A0A317ZIY0_9BACT|nr:hypothetical protein [Coraliomargarita sinensis]PXA05575.1 hypothetical protein DDZ13_01495 [Coraliomargarita sinensis]
MVVAYFVALVVGIGALYWLVLKNSAEKIAKQYVALADSYGLELNQPEPVMAGFIRPEPSVYGKIKEREISISVPGKGLQNTRQIETVLKLEITDNKFAAQFTGAGLLGSFRQRDSRGMERWKSGNESFDHAVDARTNDGGVLGRLLEGDLQSDIISVLKKGKGSIYIGSGVMAYAELGLIASDACRERFEAVLQLLLRLADALDAP